MKVSSVVLGTALIAVSGVTLHLWRELEEERQQNAMLTSRARESQSPAAVSRRPTPAQVPVTATEPSQVSSASQPAGNSNNPALVSAVRKVMDAATMQMRLDSPEGMASRRISLRRMQEELYPDVDQAMGLTTAEKEKLLELLTEQRVKSTGRLITAPESAQEREAREWRQRQAEDAEVQALLGSKYPKWQDYRETAPAWQQRRDLRTVLNASDIPLTPTQDQALINALSAEQRSINQTRNSISQDSAIGLPGRYTPENRQRMLDAAAPHLSPQQLDGYKGLLERKATAEQAALEMAGAVFHRNVK
jgi:hypothetical protein